MFKKFALILTTATLIAMPSATASAKTLDWQDMRDWSVTCRDNRYCIALASGKSDAGDKLVMKLERSNKKRSKIFVTLKPDGHKLSVGMKATITISGTENTFFNEVTKVYENNEAAISYQPQSREILGLRNGRFADIKISFGGNLGTVNYSISLQGVSSVLAMMDIVQGRLDREDAAVVSGGEDASITSHYDFAAAKAPPAPKTEEKQESDPEENIVYPKDNEESGDSEYAGLGRTDLVYKESDLPAKVLRPGYRSLGCDFDQTIQGFGAQVLNVEPGVFLYFVPCQMADANVPYYVMLEVAGEVELMEFQEPASETGKRVSIITNPGWEQETQMLTSHEYFSSTYDCGKSERHNLWLEDKIFNLSEYRLKENCDGKVDLPLSYPIEWNGEGG